MKNRRLQLLISGLVMALLAYWLWLRPAESGRLKLPPGSISPRVSLGDSHGLVLAPNGSIWSWGSEDLGWPVLGLGTNQTRPASIPSLRRVERDTDWIQVAAGTDHNLALKADGSIWSWGGNSETQLGDGTKTMRRGLVRSVPGNDWIQIEAGFLTSFALKRDGTLWAWGLNNFGQLGIGSIVKNVPPTPVGTATNWTRIRTGGVSGAGIQSDGTLWIWGGSPKLGNTAPQNTNNFLVPTLISTATHWVDVSVDFNIWLAIKSDGTLWAWGRDASVFTGTSEGADEAPRQIGTESDWEACASSGRGLYHVLRKRDGSLWVMKAARNSNGAVRWHRLELPGEVVAFDAGDQVGVGLTKDGEVWTWGATLGQETAKYRLLHSLEALCGRLGWQVDWGLRPERKFREQPWQLRNVDPGGPGADE